MNFLQTLIFFFLRKFKFSFFQWSILSIDKQISIKIKNQTLESSSFRVTRALNGHNKAEKDEKKKKKSPASIFPREESQRQLDTLEERKKRKILIAQKSTG